MSWLRVTVEDLETGEKQSLEVENNYILITQGDCYLSNTQLWGSTHQLVVKGATGGKRVVEEAVER